VQRDDKKGKNVIKKVVNKMKKKATEMTKNVKNATKWRQRDAKKMIKVQQKGEWSA